MVSNILRYGMGSQADFNEQFVQQCGRALSEQVMATLFAAYQVASSSGVKTVPSTQSARAASRTCPRPPNLRACMRRIDEALAGMQVAAASGGTGAASSHNIGDLRYLGSPRRVHLP